MKRTALLFAVFLFTAGAATAQSLAFTGVTVIDVEEGAAEHGMTVVTSGDRIAAVGAADAVEVAPNATVIDGSGKYLIPGLWDMHTHLLWSTDASEHLWVDMPTDVDAWTLWERYYGPTLDLLVANGVTGIREMWGNLEITRRVREEAEAGERLAPRMVVAGHHMDGPPALWPGIVVVETPEEARNAVDSLAASGAAFIKVRYRIRQAVYEAVAQRAREVGIPLVGHVPFLVRPTVASDAGQRSIEHLTGVVEGCSTRQDELIDLYRRILRALGEGEDAIAESLTNRLIARMLGTQDDARCRSLLQHLARNETWLVPTLVLKEGPTQHLGEGDGSAEPLLKYIHPDWRASWQPGQIYGKKTEAGYRLRLRELERRQEITGIAVEEGVPILAGSDTPNAFVFPGFGLHDELELLVEAGLTPLQALQAATLNPARFFGATDSLGTVGAGKLADLVLLDANPLEDITNTRRIRTVVADGRLYRRADLDRILAEVEAAVHQAEKRE